MTAWDWARSRVSCLPGTKWSATTLQSYRVLDYSGRQITLEESFDACQNGTYPDALQDLLIRNLL